MSEGLEDVESHLQGFEEIPSASVTHGHTVLENEEGVVGFQRQSLRGLEAHERDAQALLGIGHEHVTRIRVRKREQLARSGGHGDASRLDERGRQRERRGLERERAANRLYSGQLATAVTPAASNAGRKLCRIPTDRMTISAR